jgi:hypothetical protein
LIPAPNSSPLALSAIEEGRVDLLDVYAPVLHRLDAGGDLDQLAGGRFRVGERSFGGEFHRWNQNL